MSGNDALPPPDADVAVVDIGANSVRAVLYAVAEDGVRVVDSHGEKPRLGRGVTAGGRLQPDRILETLEALRLLDLIIDLHGPARRVAFATAAVRVADARSRAAFVTRAAAVLNTPVAVLDGPEEGWCAARGVLLGGLRRDGAVSDLGGLSLEFADIEDGLPREGRSYLVGPLAVEASLARGAAAARRAVEAAFAAAPPRHGWSRARLYGVGGAWRNVGRLALVQRGDKRAALQGLRLSADEALAVLDRVHGGGAAAGHLMDEAKVSSRRRETLPGAALALACLVRRVRPKAIVLSESGVREGVLARALALSPDASAAASA